jgi:hypothetical protein
LGATNWRVKPVLDIWIVWVEFEAYFALFFARVWVFVLVGHVHEVVAKGGIIMVFESTWGKVASNDGYVGMREVCGSVFSKEFFNFRSTTKAGNGASEGDRRHVVSFSHGARICRVSSRQPFCCSKYPSLPLLLLLMLGSAALSTALVLSVSFF